jgi:adenylylsulfate kinase-like enzyme
MSPERALPSIRIARVLVVVISGPVASGKSALSRAVAAQLEETEDVATAVIDLDLVYETLDPRRLTKDDADLWAAARRVAGRLTTALLAENRSVVAEGEFASDQALDEFVSELPGTADLRLVLLDVDFETALKRASADATRGLSKDETFLSRHYREFRPEWVGHDVLRLDTTESTLGEAACAVIHWLTPVS